MRGARPYVFTNLKTGEGLPAIVAFLEKTGGLTPKPAEAVPEQHPYRMEDTR